MRKIARNAKPITDFPGIEIGDRLAPGAHQSLEMTIINDNEAEIDAHPATGGTSVITTFYDAIKIGKKYAANLKGLPDDPVGARTSYPHGLRVLKDPQRRTIIAYSRAYEYENSEAGKADIAKKKAILEQKAKDRLASQKAKKERVLKSQQKDIDRLAKLKAQIEELEEKIAPPKADTQPPKADTQPPKADTQPPKADTQPPKADAQPPKADAQPPKGATRVAKGAKGATKRK